MNRHTLKIQKTYLDLIKAGRKTVEGRLKKPNLAAIHIGDTIRFIQNNCPEVWVDATVTSLTTYPTFRDYLIKEGLENCLPDITSLSAAVEVYESFPDYKEGQHQFSVLAIGVKI